MATSGLYGNSSESIGLYGNTNVFGGTYFQWFIFKESVGQPATPTGGTWDFDTNVGTAPAGWSVTSPNIPVNPVWFSTAFVDSRNPTVIVWSTTSKITAGSAAAAVDISFAPVGAITSTNVQSAIAEVVTDLALSSGSSTVGYLPAGTGAVATTVQAKLREIVSVKDFGAVGDGSTDDTTSIQNAIAYCLSLFQYSLSGVGVASPAQAATLYFPTGIYNVSSTLEITNSGGAYCNIQAENNATLNYTASTGTCLSASNSVSGSSVRVMPLTIHGIRIFKADSTAGSIGLLVQRISNAYFCDISVTGFDYAIKNLGGISNIYDFKGKEICRSNVGMLITQQTSTGRVKSNLVTIRNAYFISCTTSAVQLIRNASESLTGNSPGGVISIADTNFQSISSVAAIDVNYMGENAGTGTLSLDRCWFENAGDTALKVTQSKVVMNNCFFAFTKDAIVLMDSASKLVLNELDYYSSVVPTYNCIVRRSDGNTADLITQVQSRNCTITADTIPTIYLGQSNSIPNNNIYTQQVTTTSPINSQGLLMGRGNNTTTTNAVVGSGLGSVTSGSGLTAVGFAALLSATSGSTNTAVGKQALSLVTTGSSNTGIGSTAGLNATGSANTLVGANAGESITTSSNNTGVGVQSLYFTNTGANNTAIGFGAGFGSGTNANTTGSNNTFLGYNSEGASVSASNVITLGNSSIATLRCQVTSITSLSDARDKTEIQDLSFGLDFINRIKPVSFTWNTRDGAKVGIKSSGFIAQQLSEVEDKADAAEVLRLVDHTNPEKLEANYGHLVPVLVKAIQELTARLTLLENSNT